MIVSFSGRFAEGLAAGRCPKGFPNDLVRAAQRKLAALMVAAELNDLRMPPGNRLEALRGGRTGQHSIRINDQWRICFRWTAGQAANVEVVDYH